MTTKLTPAQLDRACGAVLGSAVGDALGAPYEFGLASVGPDGPQMIGGGLGNFAPGEWTDDTTMAWAILDVAATGLDLRSEEGLTRVARNFRGWYDAGPADIGNQTRAVLHAAGKRPTGAGMTSAADDLHARTGRTAGNGSLMRCAPVALPYLDDPVALVEASRRLSALTHHDPHAQEACALWALAIRHAVLHGELDLRSGLGHLEAEAAAYWTERIDESESSEPGRFCPNGWVVTALQAAWSAIVHTPIRDNGPACHHLVDALVTAIGVGDDTDTIAAIAGSLVGARWGASAVPAELRQLLHGYPGLTGGRLVELAHLAASGGRPGACGWPIVERIDYTPYAVGRAPVRHPHDDGLWLGDVSALDDLPDGVTAVVSLCLTGRRQVPARVEHIAYRLIDQADPAVNPNLDFLLADAARSIERLRCQGHGVLLQCVAAESRTPTVAIAYSVLLGIDLATATADVCRALPRAHPNAGFRTALERL